MQPDIDIEKKALEMAMRDVMDNMEDISSYLALTCPSCLEILSIEAPDQTPFNYEQRAELYPHPALKVKQYA